jgi:hypothetical protein
MFFILLSNAWYNYYTYKQSNDQTLHEYLEDFQSLVQVLEHYGAAIGAEQPIIKTVKEQVLDAAPLGLLARLLDNSRLPSASFNKLIGNVMVDYGAT